MARWAEIYLINTNDGRGGWRGRCGARLLWLGPPGPLSLCAQQGRTEESPVVRRRSEPVLWGCSAYGAGGGVGASEAPAGAVPLGGLSRGGPADSLPAPPRAWLQRLRKRPPGLWVEPPSLFPPLPFAVPP